jgi:hypothetical protein
LIGVLKLNLDSDAVLASWLIIGLFVGGISSILSCYFISPKIYID